MTLQNSDLQDAAKTTAPAKLKPRPPVTVNKPTPYTFDAGHLLAIDPNPLPSTTSLQTQSTASRNTILREVARDGAQSLLNTLLTLPITSTLSGLNLNLPPPTTELPRWKPLPKAKPMTKWEAFARKKGVGKYGGNKTGGAQLAERRKNLVYNEASGEWEKKWGYKGKGKMDEEWAVEVDEKRSKDGADVRKEPKRERMERMRRQERRERRNRTRSRGGGKGGA